MKYLLQLKSRLLSTVRSRLLQNCSCVCTMIQVYKETKCEPLQRVMTLAALIRYMIYILGNGNISDTDWYNHPPSCLTAQTLQLRHVRLLWKALGNGNAVQIWRRLKEGARQLMEQLQIVSQLVYDLAPITAAKHGSCHPRMRVDSLHACGPTQLACVPHLCRHTMLQVVQQVDCLCLG